MFLYRMATLNASNTPMVGVEVHLTNPDDKIILGLDAKLTVHTDSAQNALLIPVEAINADKNGDFLYVFINAILMYSHTCVMDPPPTVP